MLRHFPGKVAVVAHSARDSGLIDEVLTSLAPKPKVAVAKVDETQVQKLAFNLGMSLTRVAGNIYENPASKDFWAVKNGQLVRLTGKETNVDLGEHLDPADIDDPEASLRTILADLEF